MRDKVRKIWPEIEWINDQTLKSKVLDCWVYALEKSSLTIKDLETIPFSLLIENCKISFMNHKRTCVKLSVEMAKTMQYNFGREIKINMDYLIAGAILIDVGKLLEYEKVKGKTENVCKIVSLFIFHFSRSTNERQSKKNLA